MLLMEKVWFPNIDKRCHHIISSCIPCAATTSVSNKEPLKMPSLPKKPFQQISCDFCGPLPTGEMLIVVIDDYSRYPVVEVVNSTSANSVITIFDRVLSLFPTPEIVRTDNGPPFNSTVFRQYSDYLGFKHRKITPLHPEANGEVERFMRPLMKSLKIANVEGKNWKQELQNFLRAYRTTPHCTTHKSPSELLFNRKVRTRLPELKANANPSSDDLTGDTDLRCRDTEAKDKMKQYADDRHRAREHSLHSGDTVIVKQPKQNKLSTIYNPTPMKIAGVKGSMIAAVRPRDNKYITRNSSFFKRVTSSPYSNVEVNHKESESDCNDDATPMQEHNDRNENIDNLQSDEQTIRSRTLERRYPQRHSRRLPCRLKDYVTT